MLRGTYQHDEQLVCRLVLVVEVLMAVSMLAVFWLQPLRLDPGVMDRGL